MFSLLIQQGSKLQEDLLHRHFPSLLRPPSYQATQQNLGTTSVNELLMGHFRKETEMMGNFKLIAHTGHDF